ncbi:hypothetical protein [Nonomuraea angiospora]|uniref:hypothetical protein n=1 Tax=Nonomuraea angiospora TaxID=46172 RepID=UPI0029AAD722|nr:hypothetical protein [Nonomuraea angiospora]MDX3099698.1 hypothetical protein [Nonomuraea angiospora]
MASRSSHAALFSLPITHSLGYVLTELEDLATVEPLPEVVEHLRRALTAFLAAYDPTADSFSPPLHLRPFLEDV